MRNIITIVLVIIGAFIGAGFASGQEIYSFFYCYGIKGIYGIIFSFLLMSLIIYRVLKITVKYNINNYSEFLGLFIKNKKVKRYINIIINILLLITFYIMVAGFGAYFEQEIKISKIIGSSILATLCFIVLLTDTKGILKVSKYLVPILIIFVFIIGSINLISINIDNVKIPEIKRDWILSSILYCSYNLILLVPILITLKNHLEKEKNIKFIAIISGIIMIILSLFIYMLLAKPNIELAEIEMPVVYVISNFFEKYKKIYAFIILSSIFTTAISVGNGLLQNINKKEKSYTQLVLYMCITSLPISIFGFSKLVNCIYPLFGYIGIIQIIYIIFKK